MCVLSNVHDYYQPRFDQYPQTTWTITTPPDLTELRELIAEFREVVKAAKLVDEKLGTPDCVDPEKAKLEKRVAELERLVKNLH